ncbi:ATP-binding protein [Streptomyces sp. NPDC046909]|uniref:ATP-binding protein n=1 Tax=Streptomyces sp. NPDC046909 TaxID=3155617 RepID=UPI00340E3E53
MNEAPTTAPDHVLPTFSENLGHILETNALMCVITKNGAQGETVVRAALAHHGQSDPVVLTTVAPGSLSALLDAFHDALHLGPRPRLRADAQQAVEDELARQARPVLVVHEAHQLRAEALEYLYWLWNHFQKRDIRLPVVLLGPERLTSVLSRPRLASLKSCIFIWQRLAS